jgi:hypothetical protein
VKREAAAAKRKVGMDIIKRRSAFLFLVLLGISSFWVLVFLGPPPSASYLGLGSTRSCRKKKELSKKGGSAAPVGCVGWRAPARPAGAYQTTEFLNSKGEWVLY